MWPHCRLAAFILIMASLGCGAKGTSVAVMFGPETGPFTPGERAAGCITVRFGGDVSFAGRQVTVSIESPADVKVEPATTMVTLDADGAAEVNIAILPDKDASAGSRRLSIAARVDENARGKLGVDITVKYGIGTPMFTGRGLASDLALSGQSSTGGDTSP
jgi:uncharacterized membrane protein